MALKPLTVEVESTAYDLGQAARDIITQTTKAMADGWQPGKDIPAVCSAIFTDLIGKIGEVGSLAGELAENRAAFMRGWLLSGMDIYEDITKGAKAA